MENLNQYFETVSSEQFKKDWEKAVGGLPKSSSPSVSDVLRDWEDFYGSITEPIGRKEIICNIEAPEFIQELSF